LHYNQTKNQNEAKKFGDGRGFLASSRAKKFSGAAQIKGTKIFIMSRVLITGGAGFIGTHLRKVLIETNHSVRILDNLLPQVHGEHPEMDFDGCEFVKGDVQDMSVVSEAMRDIDVVYHLAAETGVGQSQYEIERYISTNTLGTAVVLQAAANARVKQWILTSSRAVYGEGLHSCSACDKKYVPEPRGQEDLDAGRWEVFCAACGAAIEAELMSENHPTMPTSVYGLTKLQQEQIAYQVGKIHGLPTTVLRLFNVYGPGQSLTNPYVGVLGTFFRQIIGGKGIDIYEDGRMRRDFVFIDDVVRALTAVLNNEATYNETINVGTGEVITLQEAGEAVFGVLDREPAMTFSGRYRLGDIHHAVADTRATEEKLGFCPQTSFSDGLRQYLKWASENESDFSNIDSMAEKQLAERNLLRQAKNG